MLGTTDRFSYVTGEHIETQKMPNDDVKAKYGFNAALLGWSGECRECCHAMQLPFPSVQAGRHAGRQRHRGSSTEGTELSRAWHRRPGSRQLAATLPYVWHTRQHEYLQDICSLRCKTSDNHHQPVEGMAMQEAAMYLSPNERVVAPC